MKKQFPAALVSLKNAKQLVVVLLGQMCRSVQACMRGTGC